MTNNISITANTVTITDNTTTTAAVKAAQWRVGAARDLPIADTERAWDGAAAQARIFELDSEQWRRAFLIYDAAAMDLRGSYKLPFADVVDGELAVIPAGLRAAASRLPQTDAPAEVLERARGVIEAYFAKLEEKSITPETLVSFGKSVKLLDNGHVGGYLVLFSDAETPDLEGDFFTKDTDFGFTAKTMASPVWFNHREPLPTKSGDRISIREKIGEAELTTDDIGVFVDAVLYNRQQYESLLDILGWSSGTAPHLVDRKAVGEARQITRWPLGLDASITPIPAEPRTRVVPLKSLSALLPPERTTEGEKPVVTDTATPPEVKNNSDNNVEDNDMTEIQAVLDAVSTLADSVKTLSGDVATVKAQLDKPVQPAGFVVQDETDRKAEDPALLPYKTLGEQLMDVKLAARSGVVPPARLLAAHKRTAKAVSGLNETVPADGGFLVQTDFMQELITPDNLLNKVLSRIPGNRRVRISSNSNSTTINGIDETSRATGSRWGGVRGYWGAEGDQKTSSKPTFRQINLKLNKVFALVYATDEVLADASQLTTVVGQAAREELMFLTEDAIIEGTGAGMPMGILQSPGLVTVAKEAGQVADTIVAENIIKMWARRWTRGMDYVWFVNQDVTPQLHAMNLPVGTGGALVYMPAGGLSGNPYGTLYGAPVIEIEYCPTLGDKGDVILASMASYILADKGGIDEASSMHVRFEYDETVFRFVYRVDGQPINHSPLTPFKGSNTVSPFVTLAARA